MAQNDAGGSLIGHNQPPPPLEPDDIVRMLQDDCAALTKRRDEILEGFRVFNEKYPTIPDEEVQGKASDFAGRSGVINKFLKMAEAQRVVHKQPYDAAASAVQGWFRSLMQPCEDAEAHVRRRMKTYAERLEQERREQARKEAEEAAKRAAEAEAAAMKTMDADDLGKAAQVAAEAEDAARHVEANAADHSRVRGQFGTVASLRTTWRFIEAESDLMALVQAVAAGKAPLAYLAFNVTRLNVAVRTEKVRDVPGCVIKEERTI